VSNRSKFHVNDECDSCAYTQQWYDFRLTWNAEDYGGVRRLYVPSDEIWLPDIVLYNRLAIRVLATRRKLRKRRCKRVLVHFEKKDKYGDDEFDIFVDGRQ